MSEAEASFPRRCPHCDSDLDGGAIPENIRQYYSPPYRFLMAHGYRDRAGMLIKPTEAHTVSDAEWECIKFLCDEWDYGFDPKLTHTTG